MKPVAESSQWMKKNFRVDSGQHICYYVVLQKGKVECCVAGNFDFLAGVKEYSGFAKAMAVTEKIYAIDEGTSCLLIAQPNTEFDG